MKKKWKMKIQFEKQKGQRKSKKKINLSGRWSEHFFIVAIKDTIVRFYDTLHLQMTTNVKKTSLCLRFTLIS